MVPKFPGPLTKQHLLQICRDVILTVRFHSNSLLILPPFVAKSRSAAEGLPLDSFSGVIIKWFFSDAELQPYITTKYHSLGRTFFINELAKSITLKTVWCYVNSCSNCLHLQLLYNSLR